ncbi:MAG: hypothetical protein ACK4G3_05765 [bacterium]
MQKGKIFLFLLVGGIVLSRPASADRRSFVWTYEWITTKAGEAEYEHYLTLSTPDSGKFRGKTTAEHQMELEVGMTDRFDVAIYQIFQQKPDESLKYDGFKFRWRYRIGEKYQYFLDPVLYLEYKGVQDFSEHGVEFRLVLARDHKKWIYAINPTWEWERKKGKKESRLEYFAGISYKLHPLLRIGLEAKGDERGNYLGPVISHGTNHLWVTFGSAFSVGNVDPGRPEVQFRMLLGVELSKKEENAEKMPRYEIKY